MVYGRNARGFNVALDDRFHQTVDLPDALRLPFLSPKRMPPETRGSQHEAIDDVECHGIRGARADAIVEGALGFDHLRQHTGLIGMLQRFTFAYQLAHLDIIGTLDELLDDQRLEDR